jgi:predicted ATPase
MKKDNFIVLTGGPGGGKSTVLDLLAARGFRFIQESARLIIRNRLALGLSPRPDPIEFARDTFEMDYNNYLDAIDSDEIIFFDRCLVDSACMIRDADESQFERVASLLVSNRFNSKVFITPPWKEIYTTDTERDQTFDEAVSVYERLFSWYHENGYQLIVLPKVSAEERVEFILSELGKEEI